MRIKIPQIAVPDFWLANFGKVQNYLRHELRAGRLHEIGESSLGYPIHVVEYPREGCVKLMIVGGTHGHEPGGVAAAMNMIHLLESGRDLAGHELDASTDLCLGAVKEKYRGKGVVLLMLLSLLEQFRKTGVQYSESNPIVESNNLVAPFYLRFDSEIHKKRRIFIKKRFPAKI